MTSEQDHGEERGKVSEPENSTVDDWLGQTVEDDTEVAERVTSETDDPEEAQRRFEQEAHGEERRDAAYPRPEDADERVGKRTSEGEAP